MKITQCSELIQAIESIEFRLLEHGLCKFRMETRMLKRALILQQTKYWNELDEELKNSPSENSDHDDQIIAEWILKKPASKKKKKVKRKK